MGITARTTTVDILQGDDIARLADLNQDVRIAELQAEEAKRTNPRAGDAPGQSVRDAKAAFNAFLDEASERGTTIVLKAIGRRRWRDLVADCPPRMVTRTVDGETTEVTHEADAPYGVNVDKFAEKLLAYEDDDVRTIVEPPFGSSKDRQDFLDEIAVGDFDKLWTTAYYLNSEFGADPKLSRFSADTQSSAATSG